MDRFQIHMIPLNSHFGETQYLDKLTLQPEQFYTMLEHATESPKTSQPSVKAFEQLYSYLLVHYDSVISMHIARVLSGTYNTAKIAAERCDPDRISVIDTRNLSTTYGLMVLNVVERRNDSAVSDSFIIRREAVSRLIPYMTSIEECSVELEKKKQLHLFQKRIKNLQEYHQHINLPVTKQKNSSDHAHYSRSR